MVVVVMVVGHAGVGLFFFLCFFVLSSPVIIIILNPLL